MASDDELVKKIDDEKDSASQALKEMGYKQELYRGISAFMSFTFCFTATNVFASLASSFTYAMMLGGTGVMSSAWFIGSLFTIITSLALAEICSVYPSAGSVYHWAGELMIPRFAPLSSFICGWFNIIANSAGDATFASGFGTLINSVLLLAGKEPLSLPVQTGIGIAALFGWSATNALRIDQQGWFANFATFFQISAVISTIVVILVLTPARATVQEVFTSTYNGTGFPLAYVFAIGIIPTVYTLSGYEAGAHLAEETRNAGRVAPIGLLCTSICNAIFGGLYAFSLMFAVPNMNELLQKVQSAYEPTSVIVATYERITPGAGALGLTLVLVINLYLAGMASVTVTSRIAFAMARDGVFPGSQYISLIFKPTQTPLSTVCFVFVLDSLFLSLQFISAATFAELVDVSTLCFQISYLIPILLRCTVARKSFIVGQFNLGRFGEPIAAVASIWLLVTSIIMLFPTSYPVTGSNMNYSVVIIACIGLLASIYWIVDARHWFVGPKQTHVDWKPLLTVNKSSEENKNELSSSD